MKAKLILFLAFISFGFIQSQEINCFATQQELAQLVEAQNFKDASVKMKLLLSKCPTKDENLYLLGTKVIQNEIDLATNDDKEKAVKELLALYDKHDEFFRQDSTQ